MKYGLVFAGGGVRGAYQIGVWKALSEIGIEISAVTGTSIGAVNGALFVQGEYEAAEKLWREISIDKIIKLPSGMERVDNLFKAGNVREILKEIHTRGGLDMSPFEGLVRELIDENKIRRSPVNFGVSAFSLTDKSEIYKFKADIPQGQLVDYLMASVCLLGFKIKKINADRFIDGGMVNNMPVNMLLERDIDNIITVDVGGAGMYRHFNLSGKNVINIKCERPKTGMMEFDSDGIEKSIREGYIACMREFGRLEGDIYGFGQEDYHRSRGKYSASLIKGIERAAKILDIDTSRIYAVEELIELTLEAYWNCVKDAFCGCGEGFVRKVRGMDESAVLKWLVKLLENGKNDFIMKKMSVFGSNYDAASAILYFLRGKNDTDTCIWSKKII